ncbi:protein Bouncer [Archocentrus centrarchus]|uniref:protein Bouncer n=1 Tax=Archocentrus centrarchus TaxID=63155 RepID=UPI0011EA1ABD|nr:protein Bouncer-like [Archocentrus centrarchus]
MTSLRILTALDTTALWLCFLLPSVLCDNLLCYYSPILEKEMSELIVTECPPNKVCFKSNGRYGNHSVLSARGCMAKKDCSQQQKIHFKGTTYTISYNCCDQPYCNSCLNVAAGPLYITLTLVAVGVMGGSF